MLRILFVLFAAVAATVVAARWSFEVASAEPGEAASEPWSQDRMELVAWNGEKWTAWIREGRFELVPVDENDWSKHANSTLAFVDWAGEKWQAKIDGDEFLLAHRGDWEGVVERSDAIRYIDWRGRKELRTVPQLRR